nr:hypothetical protein GCM10025732_39020 [Glycomyces mayteni]
MQGLKRRTRTWMALAVAALAVFAAGLGILAPTAAYAAEGCKVDYKVSAQWGGGFTGDVKITNLGTAVSSWSLVWTFPNGQRVTNAWNATTTNSGDTVTAKNMSYNGSIPTNGSVSFGFNGSWSGANGVPASFSLNGAVCTGVPTNPTTSPTDGPTTTPPPTGGVSAMETVAAMQPGWNLGNSLDAVGADETAWGNPASPSRSSRTSPPRATTASASPSPGTTTSPSPRPTPWTPPTSTASKRSWTGHSTPTCTSSSTSTTTRGSGWRT